MRFCPIASGSSGNCIYIGSDSTHILVDTGISGKRIEAGLDNLGLQGSDITGILITHEHSDHIQGLGVFSRRYGIPIYATDLTLKAIKRERSLGSIDNELFNIIKPDKKFMIGDLTVNPMHISHDASDPVAYRVAYGAKRCCVCTDLGTYDEYTVDCLRNMDVIMMESNHDVRMLQVGPYTYALKQRILSNRGHLSNETSGRLLSQILHDGTKKVYLGHLSKENNMPELAYEAVNAEITLSPLNSYKGSDFDISVAKRSEPSEIVTF